MLTPDAIYEKLLDLGLILKEEDGKICSSSFKDLPDELPNVEKSNDSAPLTLFQLKERICFVFNKKLFRYASDIDRFHGLLNRGNWILILRARS